MFDAGKAKNELIDWIKEYFNNNGKECKAVIGISGGKDSSVVAALCVEALGSNNVYGVLMPQGSQYDIDISKDLVNFLGIDHCVINIKDCVDSVLNSIKAEGLEPNNQTIVNTPARIRMITLYAISSIVHGRVANTCNLSEDWVGYSTKFGDGAGDFSPLSLLTVTEIKAIGRELGLPSKFIDKVPEDGLTGLTDEENLGFSYDVLDRYIREGVCEDKTVKSKIDRQHLYNLHKVNLMPSYNPKL